MDRRLRLAIELVGSLEERNGGDDLPGLLSHLDQLCPCDAASLYLSTGSGGLVRVARHSADRGAAEGVEQRLDDEASGVIERALTPATPTVLEPIVVPIAGTRAPTLLVVPIGASGGANGALVLERRTGGFGSDDVSVMTVVAALVRGHLMNAAWAARLDRQRREVEQVLASQQRLLEINERLLSNLDPRGVLDLIADSLKALVSYDNLTIYRLDRETRTLRAQLARDRFAELILHEQVSIDSGLTGWVCRHRMPECVNDAHLDQRGSLIPGTPMEPESLVVVPLFIAGEVVGTLNVGRMGGAEAYFSEHEFDLVVLFAGQASIALANAEAHRALWQRAETDMLTGLRNRRAFEEALDALLADPAAPFLLLMLDLDEFKRYNDHYGHLAGDGMLRQIGSVMSGIVGEAAYRYGGDEFAIVCPGSSRTDAARLGTEINSRLARERITASIGVACFPEDATTRDELIAAADRDMYAAKAAAGDLRP